MFLHRFVVGDGREKENKTSAGYFLLFLLLMLVHGEWSRVSKGNRKRRALTRAFKGLISCFLLSAQAAV